MFNVQLCLVPALQRAGPAWHYKSRYDSEKLKQNRAEVDVEKVRCQIAFKSLSTASPSQRLGQRVPCGWSSHTQCSLSKLGLCSRYCVVGGVGRA